MTDLDKINAPENLQILRRCAKSGDWDGFTTVVAKLNISAESADKLLVFCLRSGMPIELVEKTWSLRGDEPKNRRSFGEKEGEGI